MNHPAQETKSSLGHMLEQLRALDDDMLPEEFDPAVLIGDVKDKVDAIKWKMDDWEYKAKMIKEKFITELQAKVSSLLLKREKLKDYVESEMQRLDVEKIPGNMFRIQLQNSPKVVEVNAFADAHMFLNYPEYVKQTTSYSWNKEALKEELEAGNTIGFAELKQGKHIRFYALGGEKK